jgi:nucleoside-diphosphate-sugar epimerase
LKRVLLTGASGFVGSHCIEPLVAQGYEVHGVSTRPVTDMRVVWHRADLLERAPVETLLQTVQPTHLLHLAWVVTPGVYWTSPLNYRWINATLILLAAFAANGGERAVLAGTGAEYDQRAGRCVEGETPLNPVTVYGACKAATSVLLPPFAAQTGINAAWARLFSLYGPRERPVRLVPSAIRSLLSSQPFECANGDQIRDFLYVQDAANALVALLDSSVNGAVNVASGEAVPLRMFVSLIGDQLGRAHLFRFSTKTATLDEPPAPVGDVTRLTREVGWSPSISLADGIQRTIEWWKQ